MRLKIPLGFPAIDFPSVLPGSGEPACRLWPP